MIVTKDKDFTLGFRMSLSDVDELCKDKRYHLSECKYYVDNASNDHLAATNWMGGVNGSTVWRLVLVENCNDYVIYNQYAPTSKDGEGYYGNGHYMPKFHGYTLNDAWVAWGKHLDEYAERHNHDRWLKTEWLDSKFKFDK